MTDVIAAFSRLHVMSPAKGGGSSLRAFVSACNDHDFEDSFYRSSGAGDWKSFLTDFFEPPAITAGHMGVKNFDQVVRKLPSSNLAIYSHREEITRLKSALIYVAQQRLISPRLGWNKGFLSFSTDFQKKHDFAITIVNETYVEIEAKGLMALLKENIYERGYDESRMLTCDLYESIQESKPDLIFMSYTQIDEFQKMIQEKYCPSYMEDPVHKNYGKEYAHVVSPDGSVYLINDWIDARINILEWASNLRHPDGACRGETRIMEEALASCPSGFVQVVGSGRVTLDVDDSEYMMHRV